MKTIFLFFCATIFPLSSIAQDMVHSDEVVMYNYKLPVPMVYVHKEEMNYIGLDGAGEKTMYEFSCALESEIPNYRYFSEEYLEEMGCQRFLNPEFK